MLVLFEVLKLDKKLRNAPWGVWTYEEVEVPMKAGAQFTERSREGSARISEPLSTCMPFSMGLWNRSTGQVKLQRTSFPDALKERLPQYSCQPAPYLYL